MLSSLNGLLSISASSPRCVSNALTLCCCVLSPCNLINQTLCHSLWYVETAPVKFSLYKQVVVTVSLLQQVPPSANSGAEKPTHWQSSNAIHLSEFSFTFLICWRHLLQDILHTAVIGYPSWIGINYPSNWSHWHAKEVSATWCRLLIWLLNLTKYKIVH